MSKVGQIVVVFRAKMSPKRIKKGFNGNTLIFFYFFARYSVKLGEDFWRYSRVFGDKNLKHRGGIH